MHVKFIIFSGHVFPVSSLIFSFFLFELTSLVIVSLLFFGDFSFVVHIKFVLIRKVYFFKFGTERNFTQNFFLAFSEVFNNYWSIKETPKDWQFKTILYYFIYIERERERKRGREEQVRKVDGKENSVIKQLNTTPVSDVFSSVWKTSETGRVRLPPLKNYSLS